MKTEGEKKVIFSALAAASALRLTAQSIYQQ